MAGEQNDKVILMDHAYNYMDSANPAYFNNSIIFVTGGYNGVGDIRMEYPYTQVINMDNTTVISVGEDNVIAHMHSGWAQLELTITLDGM